MELVYLWVKNYKNIHEQGFNFSSRFNCDYNEKTNELTIEENDNYIPDFFGKNINVTAIVGKNGSGKSSVLEYIAEDSGITVFFDNNVFYTNHNITFLSDNKVYNIQQKKKMDFFFSPSYDYYFRNLELFDANSITIEEKTFLKTGLYKNLYTEEITCVSEFMRSEEVKNFILFTYEKKLLIPKNILFVFCTYSDFEINSKHPLFKLEIIEKMSFLEFLYIEGFLFLENIIREKEESLINDYIEKVQEYLDKNYKETSSKKLFLNFQKTLENTSIKNIFEDILKFYNLFSDFDEKYFQYDNYNGVHIGTNIRVYKIPISDIGFIYHVMNSYTELIYARSGDLIHLKFDWAEIPSSGEFIWLNSFFKIYYELKENKAITQIFIDEGESFLHPNWQKKYISYIVKFIKDNFPNRKIHIILTSHSPFLLSDIPKQNIIFLNKDEDGNCKVVDGLKEKKETFGSNIHTLLSDSFFMEDGLMGEFAKYKINNIRKLYQLIQDKRVQKRLENPRIKESAQKAFNRRRKWLWQIQKIIGEPFLQRVIKNYLDELELLFSDDKTLIAKELVEIEERKKYLESLQNRKG